MKTERNGRGTAADVRRVLETALSREEVAAASRLLSRVRREIPADLVQASLFGSKARGEARPDSDIDLLLVFRELPWDREPHASHAEALAEEVAERSGVPVTVWSVSLVDLEHGQRTPMLVDALEDSIPLWWATAPLPPLPFTPADAVRCTGALLDRVEEGSAELRDHLRSHSEAEAARRIRDDLVRMCIALHLLRGRTRPRRGEAAREVLEGNTVPIPSWTRPILRWAAESYGPDGRDEDAAVAAPPGGLASAARAVEVLRQAVARGRRRLAARVGADGTSPPVRPMSQGTLIAARTGR